MLMGDSSKAKTAEEKEAEAADLAAQHMPADTLQIIGGLSLLSTLASLLPIDPATGSRYQRTSHQQTQQHYRLNLHRLQGKELILKKVMDFVLKLMDFILNLMCFTFK